MTAPHGGIHVVDPESFLAAGDAFGAIEAELAAKVDVLQQELLSVLGMSGSDSLG